MTEKVQHWMCDLCGALHDSEKEAKECEDTHTKLEGFKLLKLTGATKIVDIHVRYLSLTVMEMAPDMN